MLHYYTSFSKSYQLPMYVQALNYLLLHMTLMAIQRSLAFFSRHSQCIQWICYWDHHYYFVQISTLYFNRGHFFKGVDVHDIIMFIIFFLSWCLICCDFQTWQNKCFHTFYNTETCSKLDSHMKSHVNLTHTL